MPVLSRIVTHNTPQIPSSTPTPTLPNPNPNPSTQSLKRFLRDSDRDLYHDKPYKLSFTNVAGMTADGEILDDDTPVNLALFQGTFNPNPNPNPDPEVSQNPKLPDCGVLSS